MSLHCFDFSLYFSIDSVLKIILCMQILRVCVSFFMRIYMKLLIFLLLLMKKQLEYEPATSKAFIKIQKSASHCIPHTAR